MKRYFKGICLGKVERHEVPNLWALNFLLHESLGGGGTVSLRLDAQGKTLSHALLAMEVRVPQALVDAAERADHALSGQRNIRSAAPVRVDRGPRHVRFVRFHSAINSRSSHLAARPSEPTTLKETEMNKLGS